MEWEDVPLAEDPFCKVLIPQGFGGPQRIAIVKGAIRPTGPSRECKPSCLLALTAIFRALSYKLGHLHQEFGSGLHDRQAGRKVSHLQQEPELL
jgi:hypothetical protein